MRTSFLVFLVVPAVLVLVFLIPTLVGVYVYRDSRRRGMNAALWTLIAILAPSLIGFILYLLVRGSYSNLKCPRCEARITEEYVVCPGCGSKLRPSCPNCAMPVDADWKVCPKCAQPLSAVQDDIVTPIRPKDRTLWKILIAIIVIPVVLILVLGISLSASSSVGSSSLMVTSLEEYDADQEIPDATKDYVRSWASALPDDEGHAYALCYEWDLATENDEKDYLFLIYIPGKGGCDQSGFGYRQGLFGGAYELNLAGYPREDGFYSIAVTSDQGAPKLKITLDGEKLDVTTVMVDFNPTPYVIASESDYSALSDASGELYGAEPEKETLPELVTITKVTDDTVAAQVSHQEPDFLLNVVVGIHELEYLEEAPPSLDLPGISDFYEISVQYSDQTGAQRGGVQRDYRVVTDGESHYLLEMDSNLIYPITKEAYLELEALFS